MTLKLPIPFLLGIFSLLILGSCVSRKEIVYFENLGEDSAQLNTKMAEGLKIKTNDLLTISVSAPQQEAAIPFNLTVIGSQNGPQSGLTISGQLQLQPYLVDSEGNIEFPVLGTIKVEGMNRQELAAKLRQEISDYIQDPIVNIG